MEVDLLGPELAEELGNVLARLYGFLRRAMLPKEMSLTQAFALNTLSELGPQRVSRLAELEGVRQPTCTGMVNAMEAQGWVMRTVDDTDRRVVVVELTAAGEAVLHSMMDVRTAMLRRYLEALSDDERVRLAAALPGLMKFIEQNAELRDAPVKTSGLVSSAGAG